MYIPPITRRQRNSRAFTLVEIAITLGIVAVAMIPVISMLPVGLNVHRDAINLTVGAQIVQRISTDIQQADFDSLITSAPSVTLPTRYFDDQGDELLTGGTTGVPNPNAPSRVYDVRAIVTVPTIVAPNTNPYTSYNLASVQILVANNPGHSPPETVFDTTKKLCKTYFVLVARKAP